MNTYTYSIHTHTVSFLACCTVYILCSKQETIYHACMSKIDRAKFCIQHTRVHTLCIWPMNVNIHTLTCMYYHVHLPEPVRMSWKLVTQHILRLWWSQRVIVYLWKSVKCVCDHIHVWITCLCVLLVCGCLSVCLSVCLYPELAQICLPDLAVFRQIFPHRTANFHTVNSNSRQF